MSLITQGFGYDILSATPIPSGALTDYYLRYPAGMPFLALEDEPPTIKYPGELFGSLIEEPQSPSIKYPSISFAALQEAPKPENPPAIENAQLS